MAIVCKVKSTNAIKTGRILFLLIFAFFILPTIAHATPVLIPTQWETGQVNLCWQNVTPGHTILYYERKLNDTSYVNKLSFTATSSTGCRLISHYENGQTVFYYIRTSNNGILSDASLTMKQTPPVTSYIVNLPELLDLFEPYLQSIIDLLTEMNTNLNNSITNSLTPSVESITNLQNSIDSLKNKLGFSDLIDTINELNQSIEDLQLALEQPFIPGTDTSTPQIIDDLGLTSPNLSSGTDTPLTITVPITKKTNGQWLTVKIFTQQQLNNMPWISTIRTILVAMLFISFAVWLIVRFTPQFKV
jgi:hypothetical protein